MRLLITGSREYTNRERIWFYMSAMFARSGYILVVVHGDCPRGADRLVDQWCAFYQVEPERYPADWDTFGKRAGYVRNGTMAKSGGDYWLAFWVKGNRGTKDARDQYSDAGIDGYTVAK